METSWQDCGLAGELVLLSACWCGDVQVELEQFMLEMN